MRPVASGESEKDKTAIVAGLGIFNQDAGQSLLR